MRFLVDIATLFLTYVVTRMLLGYMGIVADHPSPSTLFAALVGGAILIEIVYWTYWGRHKQWGGAHRLNGFMTGVVTFTAAVALLRYAGLGEPREHTVVANVIMIGLSLVVLAKVLTMGLLFLGILGRSVTDPQGGPDQATLEKDV